MPLVRADVEKIAHLARLAISDDAPERYVQELSSILNLVEQLNAADTGGVPPMAHPLHMQQRLRTDSITEVNERDKYQAIAPFTEDGLYLVPKVIE